MAQKFDGLQYIASYSDLIEAFGADAAAGRQHYLQFGQREGRRTDTFDEKQYLKNYHDLAAAFGHDGRTATVHYIQNGYFEGRTACRLPSRKRTDPPPRSSSRSRRCRRRSGLVVKI